MLDPYDTSLILKTETDNIFGATSAPTISLGERHFLSSQKMYDECKSSLSKLVIIQINFNFFNVDSCLLLANLLNNHDAGFTFCNFTNLRHSNFRSSLERAISTLLQYSNMPIIMSSNFTPGSGGASLDTSFLVGLDNYFTCYGNRVISSEKAPASGTPPPQCIAPSINEESEEDANVILSLAYRFFGESAVKKECSQHSSPINTSIR